MAQRYTWEWLSPDSTPEHTAAMKMFGLSTVGIVDSEQGGIIAYAAAENAVGIVEALRAAEPATPVKTETQRITINHHINVRRHSVIAADVPAELLVKGRRKSGALRRRVVEWIIQNGHADHVEYHDLSEIDDSREEGWEEIPS